MTASRYPASGRMDPRTAPHWICPTKKARHSISLMSDLAGLVSAREPSPNYALAATR
jgi:hypothetical protein